MTLTGSRSKFPMLPDSPGIEAMRRSLEAVRTSFEAELPVDRATRINRLDRLHNAILDYQARLKETISADFGNRSKDETDLSEIYPLLAGIAYYRRNLRRFMRAERRHTPLTSFGAKVWVEYQPVGVIGIIAPWNFPLFLSIGPMIGALAAGNRAMLKLSEDTPKTSALMAEMIANYFAPEEVCVVNGGIETSKAFSSLPFDHLVFTGSTPVGHHIMRSAAENLTPVTLELGGKSPAIIHEDFPIEEAAKRLAFGKGLNAGQICVAPDFVLCPRNKMGAFAQAFLAELHKSYPNPPKNNDVTSIINEDQKNRLQGLIEDARARGAQILTVGDDDYNGTGKLPFTVILGANNHMKVMQQEIFGPIMPVLHYDTLEEAITFTNAGPRPLALYYFDWDKTRAQHVLSRTHSGGVCINDTLSHVIADDAPFGGIGPSGMGHYHGEEGFKTFSNAKTVVRKGRFDIAAFVAPPWGRYGHKLLNRLQKRRFRKRDIAE